MPRTGILPVHFQPIPGISPVHFQPSPSPPRHLLLSLFAWIAKHIKGTPSSVCRRVFLGRCDRHQHRAMDLWEQQAVDPSQAQMLDLDSLARSFVEHFYAIFDADRGKLIGFYEDASMLTFEGMKLRGAQSISAKLTGLPFTHCTHHISTVDCQPSGLPGGMLVFVSGNLQLPGEEHQLRFSQMFHLIPSPHGSFYVYNDIFRLNYA